MLLLLTQIGRIVGPIALSALSAYVAAQAAEAARDHYHQKEGEDHEA